MPDAARSPVLNTRLLASSPATFNQDTRTVEAVVATATPVERFGERPDGSFGAWREVLDPNGADTTRLVGGPVLLDHVFSTRAQVGVVETVAATPEGLRARLRFSSRADLAPIIADVRDGVLRNTSIGYRIASARRTGGRDDAAPTFTVTSWEPIEVSLVPAGADPNAQLRSLGATSMEEHDETAAELAAEEVRAETAERAAPMTRRERERRRDIREAVRAAGFDDEVADELIGEGRSTAAARTEITNALARRSAATRVDTTVDVGTSHDDPERRRDAMSTALAHRLDGRVALDDHARDFRSMSLLDMGADLVGARGYLDPTRTSRARLERAVMSSTASDFPLLLTDAANKALAPAYAAAESAIKRAGRERTALNKHPLHNLRFGEFPELLEVSDGAEVKHGTAPEYGESFSVGTFARIFALSRDAIINDDLGAFSDFARMAAVAAASKEADILATLVSSNPLMSDGVALFDSTHGNLANSGSAVGVTSMSAARQALRLMTGVDGKTPINAAPRWLIVGPQGETLAEQVLAEIFAATVSDVNPFGRGLNLLVEPRITGPEWYVVTDAAQLPVLEYAYLQDARGPQVMTRPGFETMGMEMRVSLDFGAGIVDWRGIYKNPGSGGT